MSAVPTASPVHRCPAAVKLAGLAAAGLVLMIIDDPVVLAGALVFAAGIAALARLPFLPPPRGIRGIAVMLALVVAANAATGSWTSAVTVGLRFAALIALAVVVGVTTRPSVLLETVTHALRPLRRFGVDSDAVALALSLTLRFVPLLAAMADEVREAQWARGLDRHPLAVLMPLLVRALALADRVAEAIDVRSASRPPAKKDPP